MSPKLPVLTSKKLIRILQSKGYIVDHQTGSHVFIKHPSRPTKIATIPFHNRDLAKGTLASILRQLDISVNDLFKML